MKRIFLTALVAGISSMIMSCNNGDYVANPQGSVPPPGGVTAPDCVGPGKDPISANVDDMEFVGEGGVNTIAKVIDTSGGPKYLYLTGYNSNFNGGGYWMVMLIHDYKGKGIYYFFNAPVGNVAY